MASSAICSLSASNPTLNPLRLRSRRAARRRRCRAPLKSSSAGGDTPRKSAKLVTFLGKGGSGKTTAAVLAAQYYAKEGLRTCLVIQSQDLTATQLMNCNIETSTTVCSNNLSAVRLESSKILLDPLERIKKVDARLNLTQGILEGIVGEELGVLPGMDSILSILALENLVKFLPHERKYSQPEFDIIVYDGISTEETLRLIGATERARWYLKYIRDFADKTDIGRLVAPSFLKLAYESAGLNSGSSNAKTSIEIWNELEQILERTSVFFTDPSQLACYLVMDSSNTTSITSAMRYWGCAIQAGSQISGAFGFAPQAYVSNPGVAEKLLPLRFALMPYISTDPLVDWDAAVNSLSKDAKYLFSASKPFQSSVRFDPKQKIVTLFMPGFNKSEIKLYQYRGGSELLVEAGDQRRVIRLPSSMQGKVGGAKFTDRNLVVTLR